MTMQGSVQRESGEEVSLNAYNDYLMPDEKIQSKRYRFVNYCGKKYQLIKTNKRVLLYSPRGKMSKSDDVITVKLAELREIKYTNNGLIFSLR